MEVQKLIESDSQDIWEKYALDAVESSENPPPKDADLDDISYRIDYVSGDRYHVDIEVSGTWTLYDKD